MNQEEIERVGRDWQRRLRLQDWEIIFVLEENFHMQEPDSSFNGQCHISPSFKKAVVRVRKDLRYGDEDVLWAKLPPTHEHIVVHELLEITFDAFKASEKREPAKHAAQELALNLIAGALIEAKHGNGHRIEEEVRYQLKEALV